MNMQRIETKSAGGAALEDEAEIAAAIEALTNETKAGLTGQDTRIKQLEVLLEKTAAQMNRIAMNGGGMSPENFERKEALKEFASFLSTGTATKSMTIGSDPNGGYLVPENIDRTIQDQLVEFSPLRRYATIVTLGKGAGHYSFPVNRRGASSGWVGEESTRSETNTPQLGMVAPPEGELYAMPKTTQWLIDDAAFDVEAFLQQNVSDEFGVQEGAAFVNGNGLTKPRGFLTSTITNEADAARAFGTVQYVATGGASDFAASSPSDALISLVYTLRPPYRAGSGLAWLMNNTTASKVRQFKDGQGRYIWTEGITAGEPAMLLGYEVGIDENMPDVGANTYPVAFGNWKLGYRIVDRLGTTILRDPYTQKGFVLFYTRKRIGGSIADSNAIKLLKCATS